MHTHPGSGLVLDRLPNGELAWLRSEPQPVAGADDPDPRYVLTEQARDYLARQRAMQACSGQSRA